MIVDMVRGDVFQTEHKHIAFAVNTEGYNDAGFAGQVSSRLWPQLAKTSGNKLGEVLSHNTREKTYHALVCHSLDKNGWSKAPQITQRCLDAIDVSDGEIIAVVLMGSGFVGQMGGADIFAILGGMARSKKKVAVYTL